MSVCPKCPKRGLVKDKKTRRPTVKSMELRSKSVFIVPLNVGMLEDILRFNSQGPIIGYEIFHTSTN